MLVLDLVLYRYFECSTGTLYLLSVGNDIIECRYVNYILDLWLTSLIMLGHASNSA